MFSLGLLDSSTAPQAAFRQAIDFLLEAEFCNELTPQIHP